MIVSGIFAYRRIDWVPKEDQLAEREAAFSEELARMNEVTIEDGTTIPQSR